MSEEPMSGMEIIARITEPMVDDFKADMADDDEELCDVLASTCVMEGLVLALSAPEWALGVAQSYNAASGASWDEALAHGRRFAKAFPFARHDAEATAHA